MARCSISIRSTVHYRLKERCAELDESMAVVVERLINKFLDTVDREQESSQLVLISTERASR